MMKMEQKLSLLQEGSEKVEENVQEEKREKSEPSRNFHLTEQETLVERERKEEE